MEMATMSVGALIINRLHPVVKEVNAPVWRRHRRQPGDGQRLQLPGADKGLARFSSDGRINERQLTHIASIFFRHFPMTWLGGFAGIMQ